MPSKRTLLGAAAFSAALAGGGVAGALLGTPSLSAAQEEDPTETTETTESTEDAHRHPGPFGHRGARLETAAEALGMTAQELKAELEAGRSTAEVAEERGVDVQVVVDALVAEGTEHLQQAIEELPERAAALVQREGLPERRHGPRGPRGDGHAEDTDDAEDTEADGAAAEDAAA